MTYAQHPGLAAALDRYRTATHGLCAALAEEAARALDADHEKLAAVQRLMDSGPNPASGKPHSATSAAELVTMDPEFRAFRQRQTIAALNVVEARSLQESARLVAQALALTPVEA